MASEQAPLGTMTVRADSLAGIEQNGLAISL
jgi:hypothetical protein